MNGLRLEAAIEVASLLVRVGNASCWGMVGLVWVAGAIYNDAHAPRVRLRGRRESSRQAGVIRAVRRHCRVRHVCAPQP